MNVSDKTQGNEKATKDLTLYCRQPDLLLEPLDNRKMLKAKAKCILSAAEAKLVCSWVKELKIPDDYSSNLARCADVDKERMHMMKNHDCHVFMECVLPIAFNSLSMHVLNPFIEVSNFFRRFMLCNVEGG